LEKLAATLGIAHRVEFRGRISSPVELFQAMRSARVFLSNAMSEDGQRIPIDAMACGMPVIVRPIGILRDVIVEGVNGLFTNGSPDDLVLKLQRLLDDEPLQERLGSEAQSVLDRFERERLITMYAHFLRSFA
jgi:glycosyltransferase involved in cell wall biosynthesis